VKPALASSFTKIKSAYPIKVRISFFCAAALADEVQVFSFVKERKRSEKALRSFLPLIIASRRAQEASGTGLLGITAPRGAFPASGLHPCLGYNLPSDREALFNIA
jgi:hypothetical protein